MPENDDTNERKRVADAQIDHIGVPLWQASTAFTRRMIEDVNDAGFDDISVADSELLPFLDIEGTGLSEIADRKGISRQAVHQSVHSLIRRGYLELAPHPDDARARIARHTAKGLRLVETMQGIKAKIQKDALAALGAEKTSDLTKMLDRLTQSFGRSDDQ